MKRAVCFCWLVMVAAIAGAPAIVAAQSPPQSGTPEQGAPAFKPEELEQIVAPIALYPDALLAQVFMASTYPLEIVQAAR